MQAKEKAKPAFDLKVFLTRGSGRRKMAPYAEDAVIFTQGDPADAIYYIHKGKVKLTVLSRQGKEAVVAILGAGDFFGEDSLIIQHVRMCTATALTNCSLMRIEKRAMLKALHSEHTFSDLFVAHLLAKNARYREDLIDQLFNSSEKRLARILLLFAGFGKDGISERTEIPKVTQETLAEMVGTTRPRINAFMNKFRRLGFIDYDGGLEIRSSLLSVVLHE